jgi:hypothetical protein
MVTLSFEIPKSMASRIEENFSVSEINNVFSKLFEKEIQAREKLFQRALEVESDIALCDEMKEWEEAFLHDGLEDI